KSLIWITNGASLSVGDVTTAASISPQMNTQSTPAPSALPLNTTPGNTSAGNRDRYDGHPTDGNITLGAPLLSADLGTQMAPVFDRVWHALNGSNIAVYPLDISELESPAFVSASSMHRSPLTAPTSKLFKMEEMADETGGTMCDHNTGMD